MDGDAYSLDQLTDHTGPPARNIVVMAPSKIIIGAVIQQQSNGLFDVALSFEFQYILLAL
jgi:hypothetical protein